MDAGYSVAKVHSGEGLRVLRLDPLERRRMQGSLLCDA